MLQPQTERTRTQLIIRPRQLAVEELVDLPVPTTIEEGHLVLRESLRGWRFKTPVRVPLQKVLDAREKGLIVYILRAFASERANLIPWVFENQSLVRLARHFLRHYSGSTQTFYTYVDSLSRYSRFLGHSPDFIIQDVKAGGNIVDAVRVQSHIGFLEDYLAHLQDDGLSVGRSGNSNIRIGEVRRELTFCEILLALLHGYTVEGSLIWFPVVDEHLF